jgi:predicted ATPase
MVAQVRGVVFQRDAYGFYGPDDLQTAQQALEDVATGLGFDDIDAYLNAVMTEQEVIVARLNRLLL